MKSPAPFFELMLNLIQVAPWPESALKLPRIQNHRGFHLEGALENSRLAFQSARQIGGLCCECDVRLSRDQIPVIYHDENLSRLHGRPDRVDSLTALELEQYAGIPTLESILGDSALTEFFNIEIKSKLIDDPLPRKIFEVILRTKTQSRVLFSSFNPASLYLIQAYCPEIPRALLASQDANPENRWYLKNLVLAPLLDIHMINLESTMLTQAAVEIMNKNKIPYAAWTVNEESEIQKILQQGAVSVITDLKISDQALSKMVQDSLINL